MFHAYIGIGQMGNQLLSEQLSYDFSLQKALEANDTISIRKLKAIGRPPYATTEEMIEAVKIVRPISRIYSPPKVITKEDEAAEEEEEEEGELEALMSFLLDKNISFKKKKELLYRDEEDKTPGFRLIWPTCANINLLRDVPEWQIPVYILHGENDHYTEFSVAKMYYDSLQAPEKKWFPFKNAGHGPIFVYPEKYRAIMETEVLNRNK